GDGDDIAHGGPQNDVIFGQKGNDNLSGDAGNDNIIGSVGNDTVDGGANADWILGDDGTIANDRSSISVQPNDATDRPDTPDGGDTMHGDAQDDYMEGNGGGDSITGDAGQDDIIGGTSAAGSLDAGDTICGGDCLTPGLLADHDAIVGDNGTITRPGPSRVDG